MERGHGKSEEGVLQRGHGVFVMRLPVLYICILYIYIHNYIYSEL